MPSKNRAFALNLLALAAGMLMLAYASVPLYRLFCQVTGYGGTTMQGQHKNIAVLDRNITLRFNADIDPKLPWRFSPGEKERMVRIGEQGLTYFVAKNKSNKPVTGRAIYNVVPHLAGQYFVKIQCFCFDEQTLEAEQEVNMPISFYIDPRFVDDPDLKDVETITLSYTFFLNKK